MKEYSVKYTEQVLNQVDEIVTYILDELQAVYAANSLLESLERNMQSLDSMPERFPLVDYEPWRSEGIRKMVIAGYLVYYWVNDGDKTVWIITVVSQLRNQENVLQDFHIVDKKVTFNKVHVAEEGSGYN